MNEYQEKQISRMTAFFDAVLAIAITLLILEFAIPTFETFDMSSIDRLGKPITNLVLSFLVLANVWILHSRYFSLTGWWDQFIMLGHLVVILLAAVFPKTTSLFSEYPDSELAFYIYIGNFVIMFIVLHAVGLYAIFKQNSKLDNKRSIKNPVIHTDELSDGKLVDGTRTFVKRMMLAGPLYLVVDMALMTGACVLLVSDPRMCYILFAIDMVFTGLWGHLILVRTDMKREEEESQLEE